jgi:hypothetical protein
MGRQRLIIAEALDCPPGYALSDILVVLGDLHAGAGCRFDGPVYVGGHCEMGKESRVMALAAGKRLVLGPRIEVTDWVDCEGPLEIRTGGIVQGCAASRHSIRLGEGSAASQLFAPAVITSDYAVGPALAVEPGPSLELLRPARSTRRLDASKEFDPAKLTPLGAETWVYDGSLNLSRPLILKSKLVVRGSLACPAGSLIEDDLKAGGDIQIGRGSIVNGVVSARGNLALAQHCLFSDDLSAGMKLRLGEGVRGFRQGAPVTVSAGASIQLDANVIVRGDLRATGGIRQERPRIAGGLDLLLAHG